MTEWNKAFWAIFIILGAIIIAGSMVHILYLDLLFGLLVIGVGAAKLAEEITDRRLQRKHAAMNESINYLTRQVDSTTGTAERLKDMSESRFFKIDRRLNDIGGKMEDKYEGAVKKVISLENRLNEHSKLMLELAKRQEIIKDKQEAVGEKLRHAIERGALGHAMRQGSHEHMPRAQQKPSVIRVPEQKPQTIFVPSAATAPEKRIMRFELPRIAPRTPAKAVPKKSGRPKRKSAKAKSGRMIVTAGKTIINIQAPKRVGKALNKKKTKR